jgi:two-component system response regulator BaeR
MSASLLIVEDEPRLQSLLADYAVHAGYRARTCNSLAAARQAFVDETPDLVLLDVMLPDGSGLDLCRELRNRSSVPIIIVSARVDELDRLLGLELGADDYVCKPFSPREVMARVKAVLRRHAGHAASAASGAADEDSPPALTLHSEALTCSFQGQTLQLTPVEFALLALLARHPGHIHSRQRIMDAMYADHRVVSDRTVDSHVRKLRQKMATSWPDWRFIESVYGAGYRLELTAADDAQ